MNGISLNVMAHCQLLFTAEFLVIRDMKEIKTN